MTDVRAEAQQQLVDYLNQQVDPYDFQYMMADWNPELADKLDNQADLLSERDLADFTAWLRKPLQQDNIMQGAGADAPSYLFFSSARKAAPGSWFIHFTNEKPFTAFEYGAYGDALGLTVHFRDRKRNMVDCDINNDGTQGVYGTLYGFAFDLKGRDWLIGKSKYGKNAVIFQHKYAVTAHHSGDQEWQVLFPLCGEYNAVPIYDVWGTGGGTVPTNDGDKDFDSWQDIAAWVTAKTKKRKRAALGGLRVLSSWAPGVRLDYGSFGRLMARGCRNRRAES